MALRTNSKEVREAVREHIRESLSEPTAYDALQVLKQELGNDWARDGSHAAFKRWVQGLAFGDFMHAREAVAGWLHQTPEETAGYTNEQSERLYVSLLDREFFKMAEDDAPPLGWRIDLTPYVQRSETGQGKVLSKLDVYRDGTCTASVSGLEPWRGNRLFALLDRSIRETGDLPFGIRNAPDSPQYGSLPDALKAVAGPAFDYMRADERDIDAWRRGAINDDTYYASVDDRYRRMQNDPRLSLSLQDLVSEEGDRYFEESGCRAAKTAGAAQIAAGRVSLATEAKELREAASELCGSDARGSDAPRSAR